MKRIFTVFVFMLTLGMPGLIIADGLEDFTNFPETGNSYSDGTFAGNDGSTWYYYQCRGDIHIAPPTPTLGKNRTPVSSVESGVITGGMGVLSFDYMQAFSSNVMLDVMVNGVVVATVTSNSEVNIVKSSGSITVNIPGDIVLKFVQNNTSSGQVSIDNITWTGYSGSALPEPTNYPDNFAAVAGPFSVSLSWDDATTGAQLPQAYLIKASLQDNITAPVDGTFVIDDLDLSDGSGAKNVTQGIGNYVFTGLENNKKYYFRIYPYTNLGSLVDYKTDGSVPAASATTPNLVLIHSQNFDDLSFGNWNAISVTGDELWAIDDIHGVNGTACAKMSGYANSASHLNEDWLISPQLNLSGYSDEVLQFQTAMNYTGEVLDVLISTNYSGSGDPNQAYWEELQATLSAGGWAWTFSGNIPISAFASGNCHIAFKYTSSDSESSTWEVDEIRVYGQSQTGINPVSSFRNRVYPNPAVQSLFIKVQEAGEAALYSLTGERLMNLSLTSGVNTLNVSGLPSGIYFVKITQGSQVETHKVIRK